MSNKQLFRNPFMPKKAPLRKATTISPLQMDASERAREFGLDYDDAYMRLGDQIFSFDPENGEWYEETSDRSSVKTRKPATDTQTNNKELQKLQKGHQQLQEENNLLKVKNEVLLDMISEVYSEMRLEDGHKKN